MSETNKTNILSSFLIKKNGKLNFKNSGQKKLYELFVNSLEEGVEVEFFYSSTGIRGSLGKVAQVNICLRTLAEASGNSYEDVKKQAKVRAGFCIKNNCKSLGDMDTTELNAVLQAVYEMGDFVGCNLR